MPQQFSASVVVIIALVFGVGCAAPDSRSAASAPPASQLPGADLVEPEIISSQNGLLQARLIAAPSEITVAGRTFRSNVYNGSYLAPTLRVQRGDSVRLTLENRIGPADVFIKEPQPTNLHYHGMSIPPLKPADYVYLHVTPQGFPELVTEHDGHPVPVADIAADSFVYRFQVPTDHANGEYWYHPHKHGFAQAQVMSGLSGMILVEGMLEDHYPEFAVLRQRVLLLKDIRLPGASDDSALTKSINGQLRPSVPLQPGEWQVWHVGNVGANAFFDLSVTGQPVWLLALDGNLLLKPEPVTSVFLVAGARATVVVGGLPEGRYPLHSLEIDTGPAGDPNPDVVLGTVTVAGSPMDGAAIPARLAQPAVRLQEIRPSLAEFRTMRITRRRVIEFSETADGQTFFINGKQFDPMRDDITVQLGDVEEWTIRNLSKELHVFHIHQLDFAVTRFRGEEYDVRGLRDVVDIPFERNGVPGEVTLIIPFTNPIIVGKFVFHCHILEHEDAGMMANLVVKSRAPTGR